MLYKHTHYSCYLSIYARYYYYYHYHRMVIMVNECQWIPKKTNKTTVQIHIISIYIWHCPSSLAKHDWSRYQIIVHWITLTRRGSKVNSATFIPVIRALCSLWNDSYYSGNYARILASSLLGRVGCGYVTVSTSNHTNRLIFIVYDTIFILYEV